MVSVHRWDLRPIGKPNHLDASSYVTSHVLGVDGGKLGRGHSLRRALSPSERSKGSGQPKMSLRVQEWLNRAN